MGTMLDVKIKWQSHAIYRTKGFNAAGILKGWSGVGGGGKG